MQKKQKKTKAQDLIYKDTTNVELEIYGYTGNN